MTPSTQSKRVEVVSNACARLAITTPVRIATPSADQPIGRQRAPNARSVARALLALEPLHRRHGDEDERDRSADPDDRGQQVHRAESRVHDGVSSSESVERRARPADAGAADANPRSGAAASRAA